MDAGYILEMLQAEPVDLKDLPEEFGIYALWDHDKQIRYIGSTPKATEGFRTRVCNKHSTGSEGRSHKFSQAYCTGRMWRHCKKLTIRQPLSMRQRPIETQLRSCATHLSAGIVLQATSRSLADRYPNPTSPVSRLLSLRFSGWLRQACGSGKASASNPFQSQLNS